MDFLSAKLDCVTVPSVVISNALEKFTVWIKASLLVAAEARRLPFFYNDTAPTEFYALSLHDSLPISTSSPWAPAKYVMDFLSAKLDCVTVPTVVISNALEKFKVWIKALSFVAAEACRLLVEKLTITPLSCDVASLNFWV